MLRAIGVIEQSDSSKPVRWGDMRIAASHLQVFMPKNLCDSQQVYALHTQVRRAGMSKIVEMEVSDTGFTKGCVPGSFHIMSVRLAR